MIVNSERFRNYFIFSPAYSLIMCLKAYSKRFPLYDLYLLVVKMIGRKVTKSSPRIGQSTETQFCFLSSHFYSVLSQLLLSLTRLDFQQCQSPRFIFTIKDKDAQEKPESPNLSSYLIFIYSFFKN